MIRLVCFDLAAIRSKRFFVTAIFGQENEKPHGVCVGLMKAKAKPHASASTISFKVAQPPTFSAAALATTIEAPTLKCPLEEGAAFVSATVAVAFGFGPGFFFPGVSVFLTPYT